MRNLTDDKIEEMYVKAGSAFGDAVSYIFIGECEGFENMLTEWEQLEEEYSNRGYKTISLDDFVECGGYGKPINNLLRQKRKESEQPRLHAKIYREHHLGKHEPKLDIQKLETGEMQSGKYYLPSTEDPNVV